MKKYLQVIVHRKDGTKFENPLKIAEVYLIPSMLKDNIKVEIAIVECTEADYKLIFN